MAANDRTPRFDFKRFLTRVSRIHEEVHVQGGMLGRVVTDETIAQYAPLARKALRLPASADAAISPLLDPFLCQEIKDETARRLPIRLAGHYPFLKDGSFGQAIVPVSNAAWEPLRITELRLGPIRPRLSDDMMRLRLKMKADRLTGPHAGLALNIEVPHSLMVGHYSRILAFGLRQHTPTHPELAGMVFYGLLDTRSGEPRLREVAAPLNYRRFNRAITKRRAEPCPRSRTGKHDCSLCGYGLDACDRACHLRTWQFRYCPGCGKPKAWFDPEQPRQRLCLACEPHLIEARELARRERLLG